MADDNLMPFRPKISPIHVLLLVQLEASPKYGYEMLKSMKEAFDGVWEPKTGTIYPALKSLEKRGLVATRHKEGVDFYFITERGRKFLKYIGRLQVSNIRFSGKFISTLAKWMSPKLKEDVLQTIVSVTQEDIDFFGGLLNLVDEDVDLETRLRVLKSIRKNLGVRLEEIDTKIKELEVVTD